jgi:hypothetical protein
MAYKTRGKRKPMAYYVNYADELMDAIEGDTAIINTFPPHAYIRKNSTWIKVGGEQMHFPQPRPYISMHHDAPYSREEYEKLKQLDQLDQGMQEMIQKGNRQFWGTAALFGFSMLVIFLGSILGVN